MTPISVTPTGPTLATPHRPARRVRIAWSVPWLVFLVFPVLDLVTVDRPVLVRCLIGAALVVFAVAHLAVLDRFSAVGALRPPFIVVTVLAVALPLLLGVDYAGLLIYVSAGAAASLPARWVWPVTVVATVICLAVVILDRAWLLTFLPAMCLLTAFALLGTRALIVANAELAAARAELAQHAVAEERMRFARDLHDLLGHSLSLIALKSELAGRLVAVDPERAGREIGDVESAARQALSEVREAVSGYRQVTLAQAVAEARAALGGSGIAVRVDPEMPDLPTLPEPVDTALGWVVREATTNVLRHSAAESVMVSVTVTAAGVVLSVADDGRGPRDGAEPGSGLRGLRERTAALGGSLTAGSGPRGGYRLRVDIPVPGTDVDGVTR